MPPLKNLRWEIFCQEYLVDLNATQAYIRTYPNASPETANANGSALLGNTSVRARVDELKQQRISRVEIKQDDVLKELLILIKSSVKDYQIDDRGLVDVKADIPEEMIRAVSGIKRRIKRYKDGDNPVEVEETEFRLWPKDRAVEMGMRHLGLFNDKLKLSGNPDEPITVQNISNLTDEELANRAKELAEKVKDTK